MVACHGTVCGSSAVVCSCMEDYESIPSPIPAKPLLVDDCWVGNQAIWPTWCCATNVVFAKAHLEFHVGSVDEQEDRNGQKNGGLWRRRCSAEMPQQGLWGDGGMEVYSK